MSQIRRFIQIFCLALACASVASLTATAAISDEANKWEAAVTEEIWLEHFCRVTFFSHIVERETKNGKIVMVKVHCEDKRSFDAIRQDTYSPFTFSECTPREKTSC